LRQIVGSQFPYGGNEFRAGTLVTYLRHRNQAQNSLVTGLLIIGVGTALAIFAFLAKKYATGPAKAEKWERAEIMKQLLALSEQENRALAIVSRPASNPQLAPPTVTASDTLQENTFRQQKSKRKNSHSSPTKPIPLRPDRTDAKVEEQIRQRAYQLYQERGGGKGNATDDWLQAKQEVLSQKASTGRT
jgi:Protein of unknown function (DUF2934)